MKHQTEQLSGGAEPHRDGGPAFPVECSADASDNGHQTGHRLFQQYGMTLRDYFAAKVMQAACGHQASGRLEDWLAINAKFAYIAADALLKARGSESS